MNHCFLDLWLCRLFSERGGWKLQHFQPPPVGVSEGGLFEPNKPNEIQTSVFGEAIYKWWAWPSRKAMAEGRAYAMEINEIKKAWRKTYRRRSQTARAKDQRRSWTIVKGFAILGIATYAIWSWAGGGSRRGGAREATPDGPPSATLSCGGGAGSKTSLMRSVFGFGDRSPIVHF